MIGYIDGYDFKEMNAMKYWAPPASWDLEKKKEKTRSRILAVSGGVQKRKMATLQKLLKMKMAISLCKAAAAM